MLNPNHLPKRSRVNGWNVFFKVLMAALSALAGALGVTACTH